MASAVDLPGSESDIKSNGLAPRYIISSIISAIFPWTRAIDHDLDRPIIYGKKTHIVGGW